MSDDIGFLLKEAMDNARKKREAWHKSNEGEMPLCPICRGTGIKIVIKDIEGNDRDISQRYESGSYEYVEPCPCQRNTMSQTLKNNKKFSSVPSMYQEAEFSNFMTDIYGKFENKAIASTALNNAKKYVIAFDAYEREGLGLYLWSKARGSGKSRLASTIANELTKKGIRTKFASASIMLGEISSSWGDKETNEHKIIESYIKPRVLIIDDIGAKSGKEWIDDKLFQIIDSRYSELKPTIFTSNYDLMSLPLDTRITDRIKGKCLVVDLPNESIRSMEQNRMQNTFDEIFRGRNNDSVHKGDE